MDSFNKEEADEQYKQLQKELDDAIESCRLTLTKPQNIDYKLWVFLGIYFCVYVISLVAICLNR